jgi:hypothetical protein
MHPKQLLHMRYGVEASTPGIGMPCSTPSCVGACAQLLVAAVSEWTIDLFLCLAHACVVLEEPLLVALRCSCVPRKH